MRRFLVIVACLCSGTAAWGLISPDQPQVAPSVEPSVSRLESTITSAVPGDSTPDPEIRLGGNPINAQERKANTESIQSFLQRFTYGAGPLPAGTRPLSQAAPYIVRLKSTRMQSTAKQIVQFGGELFSADARGAAFLVRMRLDTVAKVEALPQVDWVRLARPEDKLSARLVSAINKALSAPQSAPAQGVSKPPPPGTEKQNARLDVSVLLFPGELTAQVSQMVGKLGGTLRSKALNDGAWKVKANLPASANFGQLAELWEVWRIDLDLQPTVLNDHAAHIIESLSFPPGQELDGSGQIIGHADTGIDIGVDGTLHEDLRGKIIKVFSLGRPGGLRPLGDWNDWSGHGTHTAASLVGSGAASGGLYRGVAPAAKLVHQALADVDGQLKLPSDYGVLYEQAYQAGARIHSDSWGSAPTVLGGSYGEHSRELDKWAWHDGHPRDMLIVCAAGNSGSDGIEEPGTAKNCLTVGASKNDRRDLDDQSGDADEVADFSSRGPTSEGRTKPDVVAPGTWVVSARSAAERIAWQDSVENAAIWNPSAAFSWSDKKARSGSHSWRYVAPTAVGGSVERLESPIFSLPLGSPFFFEVALTASSGSSFTIRAFLSTTTHDWEPLKELRVSAADHWVTQSVEIPRFLQGQAQARLAIEVDAGERPNSGAELFLDDFRITSLGSWGHLADAKLAALDDSTDRSYTFEGGTSMAAPMVAGAAALVREFFQERLATNPSAELLKAVLINGAVRLGAGPWPNGVQGWGRVDVARSLHPGNGGTLLFQDAIALAEGEKSTLAFTVTDPAELRVTLVWCDPPGEGLVDNLRLTLHDPSGNVHLPNGSVSAANKDNFEGISIPAPPVGLWQVDVTATTLGQAAVPQPFALVVSGSVRATSANSPTPHSGGHP